MDAYSVTYDKKDGIILISYHGVVHRVDVKKVRAEAITLTSQYECFRSLTDFRDASFELSTVDILELPESTSDAFSEKNLPIKEVKRALVVGQDAEELEFLETVSVNRGQFVKLFHDYDEARAWLLQD